MTKRSSSNRILILILICLIVVGLVISQIGFLFTPMLATGSAPVEFEITPGTPLITVAWQLKKQQLLKSPRYFILMARLRGALGDTKAGEYAIVPGKTSPWNLVSNMLEGRVILRKLTIIEGWTFAQVMQAVNKNPYLTHTLAGLDNQTLMTKLGYPGVNPEGRFYPDTYLFRKGTNDTVILKKSFNAMNDILTTQWNKRSAGLPYQNSYDALIAASLVERETAIANERPMIAGVIVRRLQKGMRLQIDPTVIYALGNTYQGKLTAADMRVDSPYNTYRNSGLPPTPIGMPGTASIKAALNPTPGDALYYVSNRNGRHVFSASLKDHDVAIDKYLLSPRFCLSAKLLLDSLRAAISNYSPMS